MVQVTAYTDGGCSGNPGPGGWGFAVVEGGKIVADHAGKETYTTNNKMELSAAIEALRYIHKTKGECSVTICTDSAYTMNAMTQWVHGWKKKGWIKSDGKPIENPELIKELYTLCYASGMKVAWQKVKAHQSPGSRYYDRFNDHVDKLATGEKKPEVGI